MKKIILISLLTLSVLSCKAQQIVPIEEQGHYTKELSDGAYIKDVNNVLGKFVGTWKGTYNNKNYEFRVVRFTKNFLGIKKDLLLIRYKIADTNNVVLEDTTTLPNDSMFVIKGSYYDTTDGGYVLYYQGRLHNCGQNGNVFISTYGTNDSKLQLFLAVDGEMYDCTTPAQQILPTKSMELNKQ
jgi:hypothetical protein